MVVNIPVLTALALGGSRCFAKDKRAELKQVSFPRFEAWWLWRTKWWRRWWWVFRIIFGLPMIGLSVVLTVDWVAEDFFSERGYSSIPTIAWIIVAVLMIPALCLGFWALNQQRENLIRALPQEYLIGLAGGRKPAIVLFDRESGGGVGGEKRRLSLRYGELLFPFTLARMLALRDGTCFVVGGGLVILPLLTLVFTKLFGEESAMMMSMSMAGGVFLGGSGALLLTVRRLLRCRARLMNYVSTGACPSCKYEMLVVSQKGEVRKCSECGFELPFVLGGAV